MDIGPSFWKNIFPKTVKVQKILVPVRFFRIQEKKQTRMKSPCFICGCDKPVDKGITVAGYSLMECPECALQSLHPFPDEKRLKSIYSDYYKSWGSPRSLEKVSKMKAETFRSYLDIISPPAGHGRLLDIGCATGDLLEAARGSGFDVYGAEVSEEGFFKSND